MAAAPPPPWPHASAMTHIQVCFRGKRSMDVNRKPGDDECSVRLHGDLILSHGSRRFGPNGWFIDLTDSEVMKLDQHAKVFHFTVFQCIEVCSELIHRMLAEALASRGCDLAAHNWVDQIFTPHDIAMEIVDFVGDEIDGIPVYDVPGYDVVIEIPQLWVSMVYTEPKALLLACKEPAARTMAARVSARIRKRRLEPTGELCAICLLYFSEAEEEEAVRLPCSHAFHSGCIEPWLHRASTCPTCRRDIIQCVSFAR